MANSITLVYERSDVQPGLQAYGLKVTATASTTMPKEIFIMRRDVISANVVAAQAPLADPSNPGILPDTFICLADPVDLEEVPVGCPDLANEMPYYRVAKIELWFRNASLLEETYTLITEDVAKLIASLNSLDAVATTETVTYA